MPNPYIASSVLLLKPGLSKKGVADQLLPGGLIQQPYVVETQLLDRMATIKKACCTCEDQVSLFT